MRLLPAERPSWWPRFSSPVRSTAMTARLGRVLGAAFGICFGTGLLSHYQYHPWAWLPEPASPAWLYRVTQGTHVITGIACIPLLLVKLWSVYPNLFRWPAVSSIRHSVERLSVFVLVSSSLLQVATGFMNVLGWYAWPWHFVRVHHYLGYVVIGSVLLHIAVKLPDIRYGLGVEVADGDVLTEVPWSENPDSHSNAGPVPPPPTPALSRRGLLAATGAGVGLVVATTAGQTLTPLRPLALLAPRDPGRGPQRVPVNRTALQAGVIEAARAPDWSLEVAGRAPYVLTLAEVEELATAEVALPITCVEGWSVGAHWRGIRLLDLVERAGGTASSSVHLISLETRGVYHSSTVEGPQLSDAMLATHLNGGRLVVDHGYPLRLIAPNRAGVLNTKWLRKLVVRA
jgi:DMSO/TMAO reductase YedYZ molybdopterin-dependent catalytic subunit